MRFIWHLLVLALGLFLTTLLPLGITYDKPSDSDLGRAGVDYQPTPSSSPS